MKLTKKNGGANNSFPRNINNLKRFEIEKINPSNLIVIYPGRFQLFHKGHKKVYEDLCKGFNYKKGGKTINNVFILTSDKKAKNSEKDKYPFTFLEKKRILSQLAEIDSDHIIETNNMYSIEPVINHIISNNMTDFDLTKLDQLVPIFAVGSKDMVGESARFKFPESCRIKTKKGSNTPTKQQKLMMLSPKSKRRKSINHYNNINVRKTFSCFNYILETKTKKSTIYGVDIQGASQLREMILDPKIDNLRLLNQLYNKELSRDNQEDEDYILFKIIEKNVIESCIIKFGTLTKDKLSSLFKSYGYTGTLPKSKKDIVKLIPTVIVSPSL
jgi:hypothetical protein